MAQVPGSLGLLEAGDPKGEVKMAWHAKEVVRSIYDHTNADVAEAFVERLGHDLQGASCPPEINQLGRTLLRWKTQIACFAEVNAVRRRRVRRGTIRFSVNELCGSWWHPPL